MKSLAAVNIRRYESAAEAMDSYYRIVEKGWRVLFRDWINLPLAATGEATVCLVVGSDQGMCGQFNEARQQTITSELLDIVSGFEALMEY